MTHHVQLKDLLSLRVHSNRLRSASCSLFLLFAAALVWNMALCEGVAWAYAASQIGQGLVSTISGLVVAAMVMVIVFAIGGSLVMLDRAYADHSRLILDPLEKATKKLVPTWLTVGLRVALLAGSMIVTAPYLAQLVFHQEIERQLHAEAAATIAAGRDRIKAEYDRKLNSLDAKIAELKNDYLTEVAGTGLSKRHGIGAVAGSIRRSDCGTAGIPGRRSSPNATRSGHLSDPREEP